MWSLLTIQFLPYMHFMIMFQCVCSSVKLMFNELSKRMCTVIIVNFYLWIEGIETYILGSLSAEAYHWGQSRAWVTWCQAVNSQDHQTPDWWSRPRHWLHSNTVSPFINGGVRNHVCSDNCTMQESNSDVCIGFIFYTYFTYLCHSNTTWRNALYYEQG
jgi:hypothetical protein